MNLTKQTWRKIRQEYKNNLQKQSVYICVRSEIFTSLWKDVALRHRIRKEAEEFLVNSKYHGLFEVKVEEGDPPLFIRMRTDSDKLCKSVRLAFIEHMINISHNGN